MILDVTSKSDRSRCSVEVLEQIATKVGWHLILAFFVERRFHVRCVGHGTRNTEHIAVSTVSRSAFASHAPANVPASPHLLDPRCQSVLSNTSCVRSTCAAVASRSAIASVVPPPSLSSHTSASMIALFVSLRGAANLLSKTSSHQTPCAQSTRGSDACQPRSVFRSAFWNTCSGTHTCTEQK